MADTKETISLKEDIVRDKKQMIIWLKKMSSAVSKLNDLDFIETVLDKYYVTVREYLAQAKRSARMIKEKEDWKIDWRKTI